MSGFKNEPKMAATSEIDLELGIDNKSEQQDGSDATHNSSQSKPSGKDSSNDDGIPEEEPTIAEIWNLDGPHASNIVKEKLRIIQLRSQREQEGMQSLNQEPITSGATEILLKTQQDAFQKVLFDAFAEKYHLGDKATILIDPWLDYLTCWAEYLRNRNKSRSRAVQGGLGPRRIEVSRKQKFYTQFRSEDPPDHTKLSNFQFALTKDMQLGIWVDTELHRFSDALGEHHDIPEVGGGLRLSPDGLRISFEKEMRREVIMSATQSSFQMWNVRRGELSWMSKSPPKQNSRVLYLVPELNPVIVDQLYGNRMLDPRSIAIVNHVQRPYRVESLRATSHIAFETQASALNATNTNSFSIQTFCDSWLMIVPFDRPTHFDEACAIRDEVDSSALKEKIDRKAKQADEANAARSYSGASQIINFKEKETMWSWLCRKLFNTAENKEHDADAAAPEKDPFWRFKAIQFCGMQVEMWPNPLSFTRIHALQSGVAIERTSEFDMSLLSRLTVEIDSSDGENLKLVVLCSPWQRVHRIFSTWTSEVKEKLPDAIFTVGFVDSEFSGIGHLDSDPILQEDLGRHFAKDPFSNVEKLPDLSLECYENVARRMAQAVLRPHYGPKQTMYMVQRYLWPLYKSAMSQAMLHDWKRLDQFRRYKDAMEPYVPVKHRNELKLLEALRFLQSRNLGQKLSLENYERAIDCTKTSVDEEPVGSCALPTGEDVLKGIDDIKSQVQRLLTNIDHEIEIQAKEEQAYNASIQNDDARRSIDQADLVSKLTVLAFFFIPISTVTSAFGMNLTEMQAKAPTLAQFAISVCVITAISVLLASWSSLIQLDEAIVVRLTSEDTRGFLAACKDMCLSILSVIPSSVWKFHIIYAPMAFLHIDPGLENRAEQLKSDQQHLYRRLLLVSYYMMTLVPRSILGPVVKAKHWLSNVRMEGDASKQSKWQNIGTGEGFVRTKFRVA